MTSSELSQIEAKLASIEIERMVWALPMWRVVALYCGFPGPLMRWLVSYLLRRGVAGKPVLRLV